MSDTKNNIRALKSFRLKSKTDGEPTVVVAKGEVVSKSAFKTKSEWQNLCAMEPKPRAEETSDSVGKPKAEKPKAEKPAGLPGAK